MGAILSLWEYNDKPSLVSSPHSCPDNQNKSEVKAKNSEVARVEDLFIVCQATPRNYLLCYKWICFNPQNWITITHSDQNTGGMNTRILTFGIRTDPSLKEFRTFGYVSPVNNGDSERTRFEHLAQGPEISYIAYRYPRTHSKMKMKAQHMFFFLIRSVAAKGKCPKNAGPALRSVEVEEKPALNWRLLDDIAKSFTTEGLGSPEEAYLCIITAIAYEWGLPTMTDGTKGEIKCMLQKHGTNLALLMDLLSFAMQKDQEKNQCDILDGVVNASVRPKDDQERTALHLAAEDGRLDIVKFLVERARVHVDTKDFGGGMPLSYAAWNGHVEVVTWLVENGGAEVDSKDDEGKTPLSWAAQEGCVEVVRWLLGAGAEVDLPDKWGRTPLWWAADNGHVEVVRILVWEAKPKGADVNLPDKWGWTPLSRAMNNGDVDVVTLLKGKGKGKQDH